MHLATTQILTLSLHDALPICDANHVVRKHSSIGRLHAQANERWHGGGDFPLVHPARFGEIVLRTEIREGNALDIRDQQDRKSTRLNSSHQIISYAVFCLKKKK